MLCVLFIYFPQKNSLQVQVFQNLTPFPKLYKGEIHAQLITAKNFQKKYDQILPRFSPKKINVRVHCRKFIALYMLRVSRPSQLTECCALIHRLNITQKCVKYGCVVIQRLVRATRSCRNLKGERMQENNISQLLTDFSQTSVFSLCVPKELMLIFTKYQPFFIYNNHYKKVYLFEIYIN